ncbi:MAG: FAD-binding protein [Burkholderiales bacterium]|nr:FAD-binding protein [Burkholderiales bacterium]
MITEHIETDILCVGGGIAGLMAAISAAQSGLKVVVAEKGNTVHSGSAGMGNDHFACYIPEVHGPDVMPLIQEWSQGQWGGALRNTEKLVAWFKKTAEIVPLWNAWGIPMKYEGKYEFSGHAFPGQKHMVHLKYGGEVQKAVLAREARRRGAKIIERLMIFELLGGERVCGALGVHTRQDKLIHIGARCVILGTGQAERLYPPATPGWLGNHNRPATSSSGDGRAIAYRLGAELVNMEAFGRHAGTKYFVRSGQGTWNGVLRDPQDKPLGPFLTRPDRRYSDMITEINKNIFAEYAAAGKGPVYMDLRGISDEDLAYFEHWMRQEGNVALLNHLAEEGVDLRKNPVEFMTYGLRARGCVASTVKAETSIKGLYAAGDESPSGEGISGAAAFGWIAGENAVQYVTRNRAPDGAGDVQATIEENKSMLDAIRRRDDGPDWREAQVALNQVMIDYAGVVRSEPMLQAGLAHLRRLKKKTVDTVVARNPHELTRVLEVFNLLDLGVLTFIAASERKETRGMHRRADYSYTNPMLDRQILVKRVNGEPVTEWRDW